MPNSWFKVAVAEAIGTFALCFIGVLAITQGGLTPPADAGNLAGIALAHGLAIGVMVAALGAISGGHFNPAVTFGFVVTGRMNPVTGLLYWISQLAGAVLAGLVVARAFGARTVMLGTPDLAHRVTTPIGIGIEVILTFFLVLVIFGTAVDERAPKSVYPFAIGLTVTLDILAGGPITGAAMNPARVFGPALASGHWDNHIVYWIGPLVGGALGALVQHFILMRAAPSAAVAEHGGPAPSEKRD
jgi:MIP family channel proteins